MRKRLKVRWLAYRAKRAASEAAKAHDRLKKAALKFAMAGADQGMDGSADVLLAGSAAAHAAIVAEERIRRLVLEAEAFNAESAKMHMEVINEVFNSVEIAARTANLLRDHYRAKQTSLAVLLANHESDKAKGEDEGKKEVQP